MPDTDEDLDNIDDVDDVDQPPNESGVIRDLRKQLKAARKDTEAKAQLEQELAQMKRQVAMREAVAGLGIHKEQEAKFAKLADRFIEGDPKEEDLKALAEEYGFTKADIGEFADEAEQLSQAARTNVGGQLPVSGTPEDYKQRLLDAKSPEEVIKIAEEGNFLKPIQ